VACGTPRAATLSTPHQPVKLAHGGVRASRAHLRRSRQSWRPGNHPDPPSSSTHARRLLPPRPSARNPIPGASPGHPASPGGMRRAERKSLGQGCARRAQAPSPQGDACVESPRRLDRAGAGSRRLASPFAPFQANNRPSAPMHPCGHGRPKPSLASGNLQGRTSHNFPGRRISCRRLGTLRSARFRSTRPPFSPLNRTPSLGQRAEKASVVSARERRALSPGANTQRLG